MANFTFGNNGHYAAPPLTDDEGEEIIPAREQSPSMKITYEDGTVKILHQGESCGLPLGKYTVEVA